MRTSSYTSSSTGLTGSFLVSPLHLMYTQTNSNVRSSVNIDENIAVRRNVTVTLAAVNDKLEVSIEIKRLPVQVVLIYIHTSRT